VRDVLVTQTIFGAAICLTFALFSKCQGFSALCGALCVILPNILLGLGFSLVRREGLIVLLSVTKLALMATLLAMCFIFFVIKIEGFFAGMAAAYLAPILSGLRGSPRLS
jgi:hypothetical protein